MKMRNIAKLAAICGCMLTITSCTSLKTIHTETEINGKTYSKQFVTGFKTDITGTYANGEIELTETEMIKYDIMPDGTKYTSWKYTYTRLTENYIHCYDKVYFVDGTIILQVDAHNWYIKD